MATLTAVNIEQRFGILDIDDKGHVVAFREKDDSDGNAANGGFMIVEPQLFEQPLLDDQDFSKVTLEVLAGQGDLTVYRHTGFWQPMDTQRDRMRLEEVWESGSAPWKNW